MTYVKLKSFLSACGLAGFLLTAPCGMASASEVPELPDAPVPQNMQSSSAQSDSQEPKVGQTKRILGIVPNFRAINSDQILPPQPASKKLKTAFQDSFDYSAFIFAGISAGISQSQNSYPQFHQGAAGYGRYYWHTFSDGATENLYVEGIMPVLFHQDNRYYTKGHGNVGKRALYAFSRTLITRSDHAKTEFNFSEVIGAGAASGTSSLYYPSEYRTWTKVGQHWLIDVAVDGFSFMVKEFWPDANRKLFHQKD